MLRNNLMQMSDQRVARISHVMLRTDPAALAQRTKGECNELLTQWKAVIGHPNPSPDPNPDLNPNPTPNPNPNPNPNPDASPNQGVIGDDLELFARCASERSECVSRRQPYPPPSPSPKTQP